MELNGKFQTQYEQNILDYVLEYEEKYTST